MKKYLLYLLLIFSIPSGYSQMNFGYYGIDGICNGMNCDLCVLDNGQYYLMLSEWVSEDIEEVTILSYGKYQFEKDSLLLFDTCHGYKMVLLKSDSGLLVKRSFNFLNNQRMPYWGYYDIAPPIPNKKKSSRKTDNDEPLFHLSLGNYYCEPGFELSLFAYGIYTYKFKGCLLSKGLWKRKGNELRLFDPTLSHAFCLLIRNDLLISDLLPGDYTGIVLKKYLPQRNESINNKGE